MTIAAEVLAEAARRGVALTIEGDRLSWRAPAGAVTPDLIEGMKTHKAAILKAIRWPRYGRIPTGEIPLTLSRPSLSGRTAELLTACIERRPPPVVRWVCCQADRYDVAAPHWQPPAGREYAAMLDYMLWEWERIVPPADRATRDERTQEVISILEEMNAAERHFSAEPKETAHETSNSH